MKTLLNNNITFKGQPLLDETAKELTVSGVFKAVLENSAYTSSSEIIKAARIVSTLNPTAGSEFFLDDADYEFVKQWSSVYPPIVNKGLMFLDFFKQLE